MDDLISRQAAIEGINKLMEIHFDRKIVLKKARDVVEQLPPARPHTYRGVTLNDVMMYFDSLEGSEDAWTEFCSCLECRGWGLYRIRSATDKNVGTTDARQDFMDIVYAELADDPNNNRANRIIWAADGYAESAQLGTNLAEVGTDTISRQAAIDALRTCYDTETITMDNGDEYINYEDAVGEIEQLPPTQPEPCEDAVSRQAAIKCCTFGRTSLGLADELRRLPSVTPKQSNLSEAYANAVFTWLMSYQIQSAQLKGRYTPYEVIGWVLNDWRKEHDAERDT